MGLEAETICTFGGKRHKVKALLESAELILRGELKRRLPLGSFKDVSAKGPALTFQAESESFTLELGAAKAATWAKKIATPPPSLAKKLGLSSNTKAFVIGAVDDKDLEIALRGNRASSANDAAIYLGVIRSDAQLAAALKTYGKSQMPIWLINIKGPQSPLGENAIRGKMREAGFKDTKTCAVSTALSGTRYNRPK